jgi:hypothetical protein
MDFRLLPGGLHIGLSPGEMYKLSIVLSDSDTTETGPVASFLKKFIASSGDYIISHLVHNTTETN